MAKYLDICFDIIKKGIPSNIVDFTNEDPKDYLIFLSELSTISGEIVYNLHLSVITGEYINDVNFENQLVEFSKTIKTIFNLPEEIIATDNQKYKRVSDAIIFEFISPYERALKYYRNLVSYSNTILDGNLQETIMDIFLHPDNESKNQKSAQLESINDFIKFNIKLAKLDLSIITSDQFLKELLLIKEELENKKGNSSIYELLYHKCNFLIKKILLRYKKNAKSYKINFKYSTLKPESFEVGAFDHFDKNIAAHDSNNLDIESNNLPNYTEYIQKSQLKITDIRVILFSN